MALTSRLAAAGALQAAMESMYAYDSNGNVVGLVNGESTIAFSSRIQLTNILSRQWSKKQTVTASGSNATSYTYHQTFTVEAQATRFRVLLINASATETMTVSLGAIAVSNAIGTDLATNTTPSTATWIPLTWNTGATSVVIPIATSATRPTLKFSDWIDISTIARTDGGTLPVVMTRIYIKGADAGAATSFSRGTYSLEIFKYDSVAGLNNGRFVNTWRLAGDKVTAAPAMTGATYLGYPYIMGVEYYSNKAGLTIYAEGDSLTEGATNGSVETTFGNGWAWQVTNLLRNLYPNIPIELLNGGVSGTTSSNFLSRFNDIITAGQHFDLIIYPPFSPNTGTPTQASIDAQQIYYIQVGEVAKTNNKPLILTTGCPNDALAWTTPQDAFRLTLNTNLLSNRYSGVDVIDFSTLLTSAATAITPPARYNATYTTDGTHPNDAGYAVMAALALPILRKYIPFTAS